MKDTEFKKKEIDMFYDLRLIVIFCLLFTLILVITTDYVYNLSLWIISIFYKFPNVYEPEALNTIYYVEYPLRWLVSMVVCFFAVYFCSYKITSMNVAKVKRDAPKKRILIHSLISTVMYLIYSVWDIFSAQRVSSYSASTAKNTLVNASYHLTNTLTRLFGAIEKSTIPENIEFVQLFPFKLIVIVINAAILFLAMYLGKLKGGKYIKENI